jgi:flagellin
MMAMVISTNTASINAQRHLNASRQDLDVAMERLSSGQRINSAADDAAGLAIRDKMTAQVEGLNQAVRNANDAISFMQSAEGALEETTNILQRMRTLAVQAVNDTNSSSDRLNLNDEIGKLQQEITRIADTSTFNNKNLIDGSMQSSLFQVGHKTGQTIEVALNDMSAEALGGVSTGAGATHDTHQITLSGAYAVGDDAEIKLTKDGVESKVTITSTAANTTGATMLESLQTYAQENFGQEYTFALDNNTLTVTSKTAGVEGRFTATTSGSVTAATGAAVVSITNTVVGKEAVAVAQVENVGIGGGVSTGDVITITITADTDGDGFGTKAKDLTYSGDNSTDNTVISISHTATDDMTANDIATTLAGKIHAGYSFKADGNNLVVTTNTAGSVGTFKVSIVDDAAATDGVNQVMIETDTVTKALDGVEGPSGTTISQISVTDRDVAAAAILTIDSALKTVGQERAKLGAFQNRLTHAVNNMTNMSANTSAARSVIADADYAAESSSLAKNQILQQAGTAMLAQANAQAQSVLSLLK